MTTCSSSPRSNEPAISHEPNGSAQPSAETTAATGTHQVEQTSTQPPAGSYEAYGSPRTAPTGPGPAAPGSHPAAAAGPQPPAVPERPSHAPSAAGPYRPPVPPTPAGGAWTDPAEAPPAAPGRERPDPGEAPPVTPGQDWTDPAEARPAAPGDARTYAPAGPGPSDVSGPSGTASAPAPTLGRDEPAPPTAPGPDGPRPAAASGQDEEAEASAARPFVIRSLDDNPVELRPGTGTGGAPYGDAVSDLVHAAVADRPLEEVVDLITSLEESADHTQARVDALRTAGVARPVEDVSRLIALLTKPPREADCADEAIRAAAAHRPVEEVTRLVTLLHKEPQEPHVREEALRAAATGRSVGELVELIDRLGLERLDRNGRPANAAPRPDTGGDGPGKPARPGKRRPARAGSGEAHRTLDASPGEENRATDRLARSVSWSGWLAALALAVCAAAHFPLERGEASLRLHAFALGLSVLCTVLALLLALRPVAVVLAGAVLVPTVLAGAQAYGSSFPSASLSRAVDLALAPPWLAAATAVCAALLALVALVFRVLAPIAGRQWAAVPTPEAPRPAE
ncbi:hypothetical protein [Streptomyces sp. NPDC029554]|uniref:hypothetical protein n=1 Tax=Streptomyces sp. NPDC029554 TaxID=3155126 RepID=UPI0033EE72BE